MQYLTALHCIHAKYIELVLKDLLLVASFNMAVENKRAGQVQPENGLLIVRFVI